MLALTGLAIAVAASVWSLQAVYSVMNQAKDTADGSPFCIAQHHDSAPIESLSELRGFRFYTTATGYKDSSTEYFHGVLAVQADGTRYYNWSPRNQRFDLIEEAMRVSVRDVCKPKADFLTTLSII